MNKKIKIIVTVLFTISLLAILSVCSYAEEGHSNMANARVIDVNRDIQSYSQKAAHETADTDYFKVSVSGDGYISVTISHGISDSTIDFANVRVRDSYDKTIYAFSSEYYAQEKTSCKIGVSAGIYYVTVAGFSKDYSEYTIRVDYVEDNDWESYPNNELSGADSIEIEKKYYASFTSHYSTDTDFFEFTLQNEGYISITFNHNYVSENSSFADISIIAYDGNSTSLIYTISSNNQSETLTSPKQKLSEGKYYLKIEEDEAYGEEYNFIINFTTESEQTTETQGTTIRPQQTQIPQTTEIYEVLTEVYETFPDVFVTLDAESSNSTYVYQNYIYIIVDFEVMISGYKGDETSDIIPSEIDGMPVTGITSNAFLNSDIREIEVPSSITKFGRDALKSKYGTPKIRCEKGSAAEKYAVDNKIEFEYVHDSNNPENKNNFSREFLPIILLVVFVGMSTIIISLIFFVKKRNNE